MHWVGDAVQSGQVPQLDEWTLPCTEADTGSVKCRLPLEMGEGWAAGDHYLLPTPHGREQVFFLDLIT